MKVVCRRHDLPCSENEHEAQGGPERRADAIYVSLFSRARQGRVRQLAGSALRARVGSRLVTKPRWPTSNGVVIQIVRSVVSRERLLLSLVVIDSLLLTLFPGGGPGRSSCVRPPIIRNDRSSYSFHACTPRSSKSRMKRKHSAISTRLGRNVYQAASRPISACSSRVSARGNRPFIAENQPRTARRALAISSIECGASNCTQSTPPSMS